MRQPTTPAPQVTPPTAAGLRLVAELEELLGQLTAEHLKLAGHVAAHAAAMKALDLRAMDKVRRQQEACRSRVNGLELKRRGVVRQLARMHGLAGEPKVPAIADLYPPRRAALLASRQRLRDVMADVGRQNHVAGRLARGVLGHLNAAVRIFARAVDRPGVYTKHGTPRLADRIGVMEAVG